MTEVGEKSISKLPKTAKFVGAGILGLAATFIPGSREANKIPQPTAVSNEPVIEKVVDINKVLSPEETDKKIADIATQLDSAYNERTISMPEGASFPDTSIIRPQDPARLKDEKMPADIQTAIDNNDYLSADGVKKLITNCNASLNPITVRGITYTKEDPFYPRHLLEFCQGVGLALSLAAKQTGDPKFADLKNSWRQVNISVYETVRQKEPPTDPQPYYDHIDTTIYNTQ